LFVDDVKELMFFFDGVETRRNFTSRQVSNYLVVMSRVLAA